SWGVKPARGRARTVRRSPFGQLVDCPLAATLRTARRTPEPSPNTCQRCAESASRPHSDSGDAAFLPSPLDDEFCELLLEVFLERDVAEDGDLISRDEPLDE